jgi:SAM-dependent methyltransferase
MSDRTLIDQQKHHWWAMFADNPDMYGTQASEAGKFAVELFTREGAHRLLELGAGQGRDTLAFLAAGLDVTALDYEAGALRALHDTAPQLGVALHDVRDPLPYADEAFDAVYSHMLFNMALTTIELEALASEVHRVLHPRGLHVYTVRHVGDAHFGTGDPHGDSMFEHGGFIVHFFDRPLVERLAAGFTILEVVEFEEGDLPRKLWRITLRKHSGADG